MGGFTRWGARGGISGRRGLIDSYRSTLDHLVEDTDNSLAITTRPLRLRILCLASSGAVLGLAIILVSRALPAIPVWVRRTEHRLGFGSMSLSFLHI